LIITRESTQTTNPENIGNVRLSSNEPKSVVVIKTSVNSIATIKSRARGTDNNYSPNASITPLANPLITESITNPIVIVPCPLSPTPPLRSPLKYPQNEKLIIPPVIALAKNPAVDFLAANPSRGHLSKGRKGVGSAMELVGSFGVREPYILPIVDAAVSAQESLQTTEMSRWLNNQVEPTATHIRIATTAISNGNTTRAKITPIKYQTTPLTFF